MAKNPCKRIEEYFPITSTAWETASYYNGFYTWLHINKNAVDSLYARLPGDHYNPKNGMETYTKLLDFYDKSFNTDPTHADLIMEVLKKTQEKIQQNLPKIKAGDEVILKSFKKSAQLFSPDTINNPITDRDFYLEELSNMGAYYRGKIMQSYYSAFNDMDKAIAQQAIPDVEGVIKPDYTYRMGKELKELLQGAFDNMPTALSSAESLAKFLDHLYKQDALRFLKTFNEAPLKNIIGYDIKNPDGTRIEAMSGKPDFERIFSETPITGIQDFNYTNMIRSFEGNYQPAVQIENTMSDWFKRLRGFSGDLARFARSFLNIPSGAMYLVQGMVSYSFQVISDIATSQGEYSLSQLSKIAKSLGYPTTEADTLITRYLADDAGTIYDGGLSPLRKLGQGLENVISDITKNKLVGEAAKEAILGWQNVADVLFRNIIFQTSLWKAINKRGFTVGGLEQFLAHPNLETKEYEIQQIKELTDDYYQSQIAFYLSPVGNTRSIHRSGVLSLFTWLNSRGFGMAKNLVNISVGNIAGHLVNGLVNRGKGSMLMGKEPPTGHWYDGVIDYIANDPKYHSFLKLLFYTMYLGNKTDMLIDDDRQEESITERIMSSVKFGSWLNNFFQGAQSELIYRLIESAVDGYNNPLTKDKAAGIASATIKQFAREFGRQRGGADMLLGFTYALANGTATDGFQEGLQRGWETLKRSATGMNRFYASQVEEGIDKNNVPMTEFDQLSILFGFQVNNVKELQEKVAVMSSANGIKDNARKRFTTNILTNDLPFVRGFAKATAAIKAEDYKGSFNELIDVIMKDQTKSKYIETSTVPITWTDDYKLNAEWQDTVANALEKWIVYPKSSNQFASMREDTLVRQATDITDRTVFDYYKPIADVLLKSKLSEADLSAATKIFEKRDLDKAGGLYFLATMEAKQPGMGAVVLGMTSNKMRYEAAKAAGYYSMADAKMPDETKLAINTKVNTLLSPYLAFVNQPEYQSLMTKYLLTNPETKDAAASIKDNADVQNAFKAWLLTATVGLETNNPGTIYQGTNIGQAINYIKDDELKIRTIGNIDQMITKMDLPEANKLNLRLALFDQSKAYIDKAIKDPKRAAEHKDLLQYPMQVLFGTFNQAKSLVDDVTMTKTYSDATGKLYDAFFGDSSSGYSNYKKYTSYYDKIRQYDSSPYVKDFILKNYNGYSNQSYGSKYPAAYRDRVRAITQLDYRDLPGNVKSERMIREFRSPDERGLPGGTFTKSSGTSKPYRVGEGTTTPKSKPKGF